MLSRMVSMVTDSVKDVLLFTTSGLLLVCRQNRFAAWLSAQTTRR